MSRKCWGMLLSCHHDHRDRQLSVLWASVLVLITGYHTQVLELKSNYISAIRWASLNLENKCSEKLFNDHF